MKKASFLGHNRPLICAMVQDSTPDEMIDTIYNSLYDGAEAFGIQLEYLKREYRTENELKRIFESCRGLPIYITSYRNNKKIGPMSDEECVDLLLLGARCGATLCDVMGDLFCCEENEVTFNEDAIKKQKKVIAKIHEIGCEVLMSSHLHGFYKKEDVYKYAKAQRERGADVVKIVNFARSEEELLENLEICINLKHEIDAEYLYLANGDYSRILRQIGGKLGCCMYLGVHKYAPWYSKEQPTVRALKQIRDNMIS